jgi:hypothetical protein
MLLILTPVIHFNYSKLVYIFLMDTFAVQYFCKIKIKNKGFKVK